MADKLQEADKIALLRDIDPSNVIVFDGVKPIIIRTYEHAIKLHLMEFQKNMKDADWFSLMALILTSVSVLISGNFTNFLNIPSDVWKSFFFIDAGIKHL